MSRRIRSEEITVSMIYDLVDRKVGVVEGKVDDVAKQVANINGRLMMIPILISGAIGAFFFIINLVIKK